MNLFIARLDEQFAHIHRRSSDLIREVVPECLYSLPRVDRCARLRLSGGEHLLRSAAAIEQACGGITANLWDDPFEWTLPETLSTREKVSEYLEEVEATRRRAFQLFKSDEDLLREIMAPWGKTQLLSLLLDTLVRSAHHQGAASEIFKLVLTDDLEKPDR